MNCFFFLRKLFEDLKKKRIIRNSYLVRISKLGYVLQRHWLPIIIDFLTQNRSIELNQDWLTTIQFEYKYGKIYWIDEKTWGFSSIENNMHSNCIFVICRDECHGFMLYKHLNVTVIVIIFFSQLIRFKFENDAQKLFRVRIIDFTARFT